MTMWREFLDRVIGNPLAVAPLLSRLVGVLEHGRAQQVLDIALGHSQFHFVDLSGIARGDSTDKSQAHHERKHHRNNHFFHFLDRLVNH
jgi:hypothetical protein